MISTKFKKILNGDIESSMITSTPTKFVTKWNGGRHMMMKSSAWNKYSITFPEWGWDSLTLSGMQWHLKGHSFKCNAILPENSSAISLRINMYCWSQDPLFYAHYFFNNILIWYSSDSQVKCTIFFVYEIW